MTQKIISTASARAIALPLAISPEDGLRRYLQEIAKFPMLEQKEELALSRRWRDHGDVEAAHQLVTSHLRLVAKIAFKFRGYGLPVGELISEGNIGMMQAVKRFDPDKGFRLATYAIWWIKASMQEYILRSWSSVKIGSSAAQKRLFFNLRKVKAKIGDIHEHGMNDEQIDRVASMLDVSRDDVIDMDQRMSGRDVYLNSKMGEDGDDEKMDFLVEPSDNQEIQLANREEMSGKQALLQQAMTSLSDRERDILQRRRLKDDPDTLEALSQDYGISRERVRQIEVRAFEKLQEEMTAAA